MPQASSSEQQDPDDADSQFVEVDPSGRYGRYKKILGSGSSKKVYRAFDEWEGIEVAWNQVKVSNLLRNSDDLDRLYSELHLLKTLKHKNIIKFYNSWVDSKHEYINFITEIFTSGNLRQYRNKHKNVELRALKKWSKQILEGLLYLHSHDPPVIHRDLKCDNIFVNGNQGEVKIADLGLAAILCPNPPASRSCIGDNIDPDLSTPEFMAPELYKEEYNELVDIYAFGMCLLELVTLEYPYVECDNAFQIYKKVVSGIKPESLAKVKDPGVKAFIEKCIANVSDRLSAKELLKDPFLHSDEDNMSVGRSVRPNTLQTAAPGGPDQINVGQDADDTLAMFRIDDTLEDHHKDVDIIFLKLHLADSTGESRIIHFPFYIGKDTAISVASEMVEELKLPDQDVPTIASMIDSDIQSHIPDWEPSDFCIDNCVPETKAPSSPSETDLSSSLCGLVLERLPSGRKYWSNSPKGPVENDPGISGPTTLPMFNTEIDQVKIIAESLESLMARQQNELDELKEKHEVAISELLKDHSPEICQKVLNICWPRDSET